MYCVAITESNVFNFLTTNHDNLNKKIPPESLCFDTCIFNKHITFSIIIKKKHSACNEGNIKMSYPSKAIVNLVGCAS